MSETPKDPEMLMLWVYRRLNRYNQAGGVHIKDWQRNVVAAQLNDILGGDTQRYELCHLLWGETSTKHMTPIQIRVLLDLLEADMDLDEGQGVYFGDDIPECTKRALISLHGWLMGQSTVKMLWKE